MWLRIKGGNESRRCSKLHRTAVGDSVIVLGVASCVVQLGTYVLEVEDLIYKKLVKSCLKGISILAKCLITKEKLENCMKLRRFKEGRCKKRRTNVQS